MPVSQENCWLLAKKYYKALSANKIGSTISRWSKCCLLQNLCSLVLPQATTLECIDRCHTQKSISFRQVKEMENEPREDLFLLHQTKGIGFKDFCSIILTSEASSIGVPMLVLQKRYLLVFDRMKSSFAHRMSPRMAVIWWNAGTLWKAVFFLKDDSRCIYFEYKTIWLK